MRKDAAEIFAVNSLNAAPDPDQRMSLSKNEGDCRDARPRCRAPKLDAERIGFLWLTKFVCEVYIT
jgi:hypothetical protein